MVKPRHAVVVIGIGNTMRGDDGIGPAAVDCLEQRHPRGPAAELDLLVLDGEPTRMIEAWRDRRRAIVIDAVRAGGEAGAIHRLEVGRDPLPRVVASTSSHSTGVAEAVELAMTLDRLPEELIVLGVEPSDVSLGNGLSDEVRKALGTLVRRVEDEATR